MRIGIVFQKISNLNSFFKIILLTHIVFSSAFADIKTIYSVPFAVDAIEDIDSNSVELSLPGFKKIVAKEDLNRTIINYYFKGGTRPSQYSPMQIRAFTLEALEANDKEIAKLGFVASLRDQSPKSDSEVQYVDRVSHYQGSYSLFKEAVAYFGGLPPQGPATCKVFSILASSDPENFRSISKVNTQFLDANCRDIFIATLVQALINNDIKVVEALLKCIPLFEGVGQSELGNLDKIIRSGRRGLESLGFVEGVFNLFPTARSLIIFDLSAKLQQLLDTQQITDVLKSLDMLSLFSDQDMQILPLEIRDKVLLSLENISINSLKEKHKSAFIRIGRSDGRLFQQLRSIQLRRLKEDQAKDLGSDVLKWLNFIVAAYPDPSRENDLLRLNIASYLETKGRREDLTAILSEIQTSLPFREKILYLRFMLDNRYPYLLDFLFVLIGVLSVLLLFKWRKRLFKNKKIENVYTYEQPIPQFVQQMAGSSSVEYLEYKKYLTVLDLKEGAKVTEIKAAYRRIMKSLHPDLKGAPTSFATPQFLELQKAYEKLLELEEKFAFSEKRKN